MSLNNENNPHLIVIPLGSVTTDATLLPGVYLPKKTKILSAAIIDGAGIAASNSNYATVTLKNGSTAVASYDTRAANQGALTAAVAGVMSLVAGQDVQAAGSSLSVLYNETGTVAMTNAVLVLECAKV